MNSLCTQIQPPFFLATSVGIRAPIYFSAMARRGAHRERHATMSKVNKRDEVASEAQLETGRRAIYSDG